ncbi:MAG: efflux RND transporter periplasmic adaptor subunit [Verrucomicrobia bacterium]|nr:efflux RND transporter periplasmic adaptor subunit [Verrucomicrobiota bacterium]
MNEEKLKQLKIQSEARVRPKASLWMSFAGVTVLTSAAVFYAWPRTADHQRLVDTTRSWKTSSVDAARVDQASVETTPSSSRTEHAGRMEALLTVSGYIVARERIELSPRFMGVVKWMGVKKGESVTNNQVVVLLDDAEPRARLKETAGRLAQAKAAVAKAELDFARVSRLARDDVESKQAEDDARLRVESTKAAVQEVEGQLELIQTHLEWTVIRSPIDGVILERLVDANELVVPQSFGGGRGPSTALLALADLKDLQVEIDLNESDLSKVFLRQKCRVSPEAYPDKAYEAYVAEIAPEANRQKGTLQVKVQIRNPDQFLTPELSAKVEFLDRPSGG